MPRKRNEQKKNTENYNKAFPTMMRQLVEKTTQAELAAYLSKTRQAITYYCDGSSSPDWETLAKIADFFDVSTDYLLGRTVDPSRTPCAADELGLSAETINVIRNCRNISFYDDAMEGMNLLISEGSLLYFASRINRFCKAVSKNIELANVYDSLATDGDDPKFKRLSDEIVAEQAFKDAFLAYYPQYADHFDIRVGARYVATFKRDLGDEFEELLRKISNYNEFITSQYKGSV